MGFTKLYTELCGSKCDDKATEDQVKTLKCLLQLPATMSLARTNYEGSNTIVRKVLKQYLRRTASLIGDTVVLPPSTPTRLSLYIRHCVTELAKNAYHGDSIVKQWALVANELIDNPKVLDLVCNVFDQADEHFGNTIFSDFVSMSLSWTVAESARRKAWIPVFHQN